MNHSILTYFFLFVCLVLKVNGATNDDHLEVRKKCAAENGLPEDGLSTSGSKSFITNPKSKCYLECFLRNLNVIKDDNSFDVEHAVLLVDEDIRQQVRPGIVKCTTDAEKISDRCEKSFFVTKCVFEAAPGPFQQLGILEPPRAS